MTTAARWERVKEMLEGALRLPDGERAAYLDKECGEDAELRREVESLIASYEKAGSQFLGVAAAKLTNLVPASVASGTPVGTLLGPYRIVEEIGRGGMGVVLLAEDTRLGRKVAIKLIAPELARDEHAVARFLRETRLIASLNHPNIAVLYDAGEIENRPYLAMEYLEGETLASRLVKGALPVAETLRYGIEIADALDTAHRRNIVHRDLKPGNIFLTARGECKVLDFGLAKLEVDSSDAPTVTRPESLTDTGIALGTVAYMSPEQARGEPLDARTDIFSLGTVLYEMGTGKAAFPGRTSAIIFKAILDTTPASPSQLNKSLPHKLDEIVSKALEKDRELRYQSAAEVRADLKRIMRDSESQRVSAAGIAARGSARNRLSSRHLKMFGALALVLVLAVSIGLYLRRSYLASRSGASSPSMEVRALTESGKASRVAATPDGRYVAYVNNDGGKYELRLLQVATERDVQVLPGSPLAIRTLHFSPDGNFIYFLRQLHPTNDDELGVFRIATLGGPATPLATDARMYSVTVSPDGKEIAYITQTQNESQIVAIDPDGANRHVLARRPMASDFWFIEWSPLLNTLAAVAIGAEGMGLVSVELPAASIRELSAGWGAVGQPVWSPDGATIFAPAVPEGDSVLQIWAFDAHTGVRRPVTSGSTAYSEWTLSATATGELVASTVTPALTVWATDSSAQLHPITALRGEGLDSVIWVDGRIVTSNIDEVIVHDPAGRNFTKLRSYSSIYRHLARCGPGHVVYWAADGQHQSHIARTDIITGSTSRLTDGPRDDWPSCTPDGSTLVFDHCEDQGNHCLLIRRSIDSGRSLPLLELGPNEESLSLAISPEGTKIFLRKNDAADPYGWATIMPTDGGNPQKLKMPVPVGGVVAFTWAPDGKSILYARNENGVGNIWSTPINGKAPRKLTAFDSEQIFAFGVSPDNRLAISRGSWTRDVVLIKNAK
jgi:eukaryotic-like serine/threonine-protein kinase